MSLTQTRTMIYSNQTPKTRPTIDLEAQAVTPARPQLDASLSSKSQIRPGGAYLNGLRGIAMLCVFNSHLFGAAHSFKDNSAWASTGLLGLVYASLIRLADMGGNPAVCFFFILTGYVLSISPLKALARSRRRQCRVKLLVGVLRRPMRLYLPVLIIAFFCALLMQLPYNIFPGALWYTPQDNLYLELCSFVRLTWKFFNPSRTVTAADHYAYDPVLWTIPLTLKGSVLVYTILMLLSFGPLSKPYVTGALGGVTIVLLHRAYWWEACFLAGTIIALLDSNIGGIAKLSSKQASSWKHRSLSYGAVVMSLYLLSAPSYDGHPELAKSIRGWDFLIVHIPSSYTVLDYYRFWHSYGAFILICGLQHTSTIQQLLDTAPFQYLGYVSFMAYAIHLPFFLCVGDRWRRVLGTVPYMAEPTWYDNLISVPEWGPSALTLRAFVTYNSILAMVLAVAHWTTRYIDEPCGRLCKTIGQGLEGHGQ